MISKALTESVLACAMSSGADFAELYGEITRNNTITMMDGKIERASDNLISGVGIRAFLGTRTVYASTSDTCSAKATALLVRRMQSCVQTSNSLR